MFRTIVVAGFVLGSVALGAFPESYHDLPWQTRLPNACLRGLYALALDVPRHYTVHPYQPGDRELLARAGVVIAPTNVSHDRLPSTERAALQLLRASEPSGARGLALLHGRHRNHRSPIYSEAPLSARTLVRSVHYSTYRLLAGAEGRIDGITFVYCFPTKPSAEALRDVERSARKVLAWRVSADGEHRPYLLTHGVRVIVTTPSWPEGAVLLFTNRFDERPL